VYEMYQLKRLLGMGIEEQKVEGNLTIPLELFWIEVKESDWIETEDLVDYLFYHEVQSRDHEEAGFEKEGSRVEGEGVT